jgi:hypothetical protein
LKAQKKHAHNFSDNFHPSLDVKETSNHCKLRTFNVQGKKKTKSIVGGMRYAVAMHSFYSWMPINACFPIHLLLMERSLYVLSKFQASL